MEQRVRDLPGWQDLIRDRFVALDIRPGDGPGVRGRVRSHAVGPLGVADVRSVAQTFRRTSGLIARHGEDRLQVGLVRAGVVQLDQDGREARVAPGSFVVYDTTRPFRWTMAGDWRMDVFTWPRDAVPVDPRRLPALTALPVREGASALVAKAALTELIRTGPVAGAEGRLLADRVAELVLAAVGLHAPSDLLRQVLDFIELRLDDPTLCPAVIARACHLSLRSLHRLFADHPRSLARWIRYRRLERARAELTAFPERPIAVLAARYCFSEPTVFARAFRDEYGCSPRDFRHGTQGRVPGAQRTRGVSPGA
ncbi:helix-turn-helix domain-containing protein [Pseudonocardia sp. RS010]|uniref:helix-turn-helix domain-containing protein n=1 Tax=Pseudonocardia sp. RS010 TaxID=3385979 RepID=UPI00399FCD0D